MVHLRRLLQLSVAAIVLCFLMGCASPFKAPLRIGVTNFELSPLPPFLPKRTLFLEDLQGHLNEPVVFDLMTARQIRVHLGTGRVKFAMLSPGDYAEVSAADTSEIIAVPINESNQTYRQGLIIVSPKSHIQSVAELRGRRFHFMPRGNALNEAAMGMLVEAGVSRKQVDKGILGLELDTMHISSLEVAKSVVLEENVAGVIDEADYNKWPARGGSLVLLSPSQEQVRIIGKTVRVPEGPVVVSKETPAEMRQDVADYLTGDLNRKKLVLGVLGVNGFAKPIDPKEYEPFNQLHRKLYPERYTSEPAEPAETTDSKPAI